METEAGSNAKDTLELVFQISNLLETGLDRHTLSLIIALLDRGVNPEPLAALVRELSSTSTSASAAAGNTSSSRANNH